MSYLKRSSVALVLVLSLVLGMGVPALAQEEPTVLNLNWGTEPPSLDPSIPTDLTSIEIIEQLFVGLGRQNEVTLENDPGMATWQLADDGVTYTFTLIENVPWVHYNADSGAVEEVKDEDGNTRYVTAQDFAYGILRTLDPDTGGAYAYMLSITIEGAAEYNKGEPETDDMEALRDAVAVEAIDDYTLQIKAPRRAAFMDDIMGLWMAVAQPMWLVEEVGEFWTEPENMQSYGPYALKAWLHDDSLTLVKNPFWPGTESVPQAQIDEIYGVMLEDASAAFANYEAGTLDVAGAPAPELGRIQSDPVLKEELSIGPDYGTYYYGFNHAKPPMDNVNMRLAFSYAIDREALVENVTKGGEQPAHWFSRPGLVAAPTMETHPDLGIGYDPDMAREHLEMALEELGLASVDDLPPIILSHNESESHARIAEAIQQMWVDELGIKVEITTQEWKVYIANIIEGNATHVFRSSWFMDYADASNFLYDFLGANASGTYRLHWNNDEDGLNANYNELVEEALVLEDTEERRELYAQAEDILVVQEAALSPIFWYTVASLTKPYVNRTHAKSGHERYEKWSLGE